MRYDDVFVAGTHLAGGVTHPASPGSRVFVATPWLLAHRDGPTLPVTVIAPAPTPFRTWLSRNALDAKSGMHQDIMFSFDNDLPYDVRVWVAGPCFADSPSALAAECVSGGTTVTVAADDRASVQARIWAREGFVESGAPLAPGTYPVTVGQVVLTFTVT